MTKSVYTLDKKCTALIKRKFGVKYSTLEQAHEGSANEDHFANNQTASAICHPRRAHRLRVPWHLHLTLTKLQSLFPLSITSPSTSCFSLSLFPSPSLRPPYTLSLLVLSTLSPPYNLSLLILSPSPSPLSSPSWSGGQCHSEIRKSQLEENSTNLGGTRRQ